MRFLCLALTMPAVSGRNARDTVEGDTPSARAICTMPAFPFAVDLGGVLGMAATDDGLSSIAVSAWPQDNVCKTLSRDAHLRDDWKVVAGKPARLGPDIHRRGKDLEFAPHQYPVDARTDSARNEE